jgi:hypothetical protein
MAELPTDQRRDVVQRAKLKLLVGTAWSIARQLVNCSRKCTPLRDNWPCRATVQPESGYGMLNRWERAYQAFETPEEEIRKFTGRLRLVGVHQWNRSARVVEICCGRGNGLRAWHALGFPHTLGVDLSPGWPAAR